MTPKLQRFLAGWEDRPFSWCHANCTRLPRAWVEYAERHDIDVPQVDGSAGALLATLRHRGLVEAVTQSLGRQPLMTIADAVPGDIAAFPPGAISRGLIGSVGIVMPCSLVLVSAARCAQLYPISLAAAAWKVNQ